MSFALNGATAIFTCEGRDRRPPELWTMSEPRGRGSGRRALALLALALVAAGGGAAAAASSPAASRAPAAPAASAVPAAATTTTVGPRPRPPVAGPRIVWDPIPFGPRREARWSAYVRRHYGSFVRPSWRLSTPT